MGDNTAKRGGFGIGEAGRVPASTPEDELEAGRLQPAVTNRARVGRCAECGQSVPTSWLVWSNTHGEVCADCYDRVSDEDY